MSGLSRWAGMAKGPAVILCILGVVSTALIYLVPAPPSTVAIAVGFKGGSYGVIAERYKEILARAHVKLELRNNSGGAENLALLENKDSGVAVAFMQGGIGNSEQAPGLLSLGRINYQIFAVFCRATDVLTDLTELMGKRISVGPVGTADRLVAERCFE
jgi:TRAP-type uncharacterized transport system substrate-binding protein